MKKNNNPLFDVATCWARAALVENIVNDSKAVLFKGTLTETERIFVQRIFTQASSLSSTLSMLESVLDEIDEEKNKAKEKKDEPKRRKPYEED